MANQYGNVNASTAAVTNRIVASTNMSLTPYTIANGGVPVWAGGANITITHTTVAGTDTLGTITIVGTDLNNLAISEVLTPVADSTVTGSKVFRSVTSATSLGWVAVSTADTLVIGVAAGDLMMGSGGVLHAVIVNNVVAASVAVSDKRGTILTIPASQAAGSVFLLDVEVSGFLKVATTSTNDITAVHSGTLATAYATV